MNDKGRRFTFDYVGYGLKAKVSIQTETLDDIFRTFKDFLQACGYCIESNKVFDLINEEDVILSLEEFEELKAKAEREPEKK